MFGGSVEKGCLTSMSLNLAGCIRLGLMICGCYSEYMLWTDDLSRQFIADKYPSFLATFDGYEYPIQRADAIRYL